MSDYIEDVKKYADNVNTTAVDNIVKYCGIALRSKDASTVAASDPSELETVKNGFAKKKLELSPDDADAGIKTVCEKMKGDRAKSRVTFYYLLAEATNTMGKLG
jgi:hypothetical protein